ncbi:hypothetical protein [Desulfovibrio psychrotolerans]|nr:hypothetical protein [Desulfovibrio psychrotolerans]
MLSMVFRAVALVAVMLCAGGGFVSPPAAHARVVQAMWYETPPADGRFTSPPPATRDAARVAAFAEAVAAEASDLTHGGIPEERLVLLREHLVPGATSFVVSYSELGVEEAPGGKVLSVDVQVNRDAVRQELRRLGIPATLSVPVGYKPVYGTLPSEAWEALGRLHVLYGVRPDSGARLELRLEYANKLWAISLHDGAGAPRFAQAAKLEEAWNKAWGSLFAAQAASSVQTSSVVLGVEGWFTPDGVEAFDTMLLEWTDVLDGVSLQDVRMESAGISGRWTVTVLDKARLESRLAEYAANRRLSYSLKDR